MIKERIIKLIENKGLAKEKFYANIGMESASFRGKAKLTPLNSTAIENIIAQIPDVNTDWLLTGKGEMLKSDYLKQLSSPVNDEHEVNISKEAWNMLTSQQQLIRSQQETIQSQQNTIQFLTKKDDTADNAQIANVG